MPVLALGEALQLRNLYDIPALQQYTYKRLGFPGEGLACVCTWSPGVWLAVAAVQHAVPSPGTRANAARCALSRLL